MNLQEAYHGPFPKVDAHGRPRTPWAIVCVDEDTNDPMTTHGLVYLTKEEYNQQLSNPDALWKCPICRCSADWNDDNYEEALSDNHTQAMTKLPGSIRSTCQTTRSSLSTSTSRLIDSQPEHRQSSCAKWRNPMVSDEAQVHLTKTLKEADRLCKGTYADEDLLLKEERKAILAVIVELTIDVKNLQLEVIKLGNELHRRS